MRENNAVRQSDRSYLCLVAIYAIHAILLNVVFLQPSSDDTRSTVTVPSSSYVIDSGSRGLTMSIMKDLSDNVLTRIEGENYKSEIVASLNRTNSTVHVERRKILVVDNDDDDYSLKSSRNAFSQSKSGGAAIRFLAAVGTSSVSRLTNYAINIARSIIERLSPAALGIISGCLVFLLTFTENDYV